LLKHCFDEEGAHRVFIFRQRLTAYEEKIDGSGGSKEAQQQLVIPCPTLQREMGECAIAGAHAMRCMDDERHKIKNKENVISLLDTYCFSSFGAWRPKSSLRTGSLQTLSDLLSSLVLSVPVGRRAGESARLAWQVRAKYLDVDDAAENHTTHNQ
jgi:hypothetical protein